MAAATAVVAVLGNTAVIEFAPNENLRRSWLKGAWSGREASGQGRAKAILLRVIAVVFLAAGAFALAVLDGIDAWATGGALLVAGVVFLALPSIMERWLVTGERTFERLWFYDGYLWFILRTDVFSVTTLGVLGKMSAWRINLSAVDVSWNISERRLEFEGDVVRWTHPYRAARTFDPRDPGVPLPACGRGAAAIYPYWEPDLVALVQRYAPIRNIEYMNVNR